MNVNDTEIERKWITHGFPTSSLLTLKRHHFMHQAYFVTTDDVECRLTCRISAESYGKMMHEYLNPKLVIKRGSGLIRPEYELVLTGEQFLKAQKWIDKPPIVKEVKCFSQPRSYDQDLDDIVVCHVDPGLATGFYYIEVEFKSQEEADAYRLPNCINAREVTGDARYSMKNYWRETRYSA